MYAAFDSYSLDLAEDKKRRRENSACCDPNVKKQDVSLVIKPGANGARVATFVLGECILQVHCESSLEKLLQGIDLPVTALAMHGDPLQIFFSDDALSMWNAMTFKLPKSHDLSLAFRSCKYFRKGFDIILDGLDVDALKMQHSVHLKHREVCGFEWGLVYVRFDNIDGNRIKCISIECEKTKEETSSFSGSIMHAICDNVKCLVRQDVVSMASYGKGAHFMDAFKDALALIGYRQMIKVYDSILPQFACITPDSFHMLQSYFNVPISTILAEMFVGDVTVDHIKKIALRHRDAQIEALLEFKQSKLES